MRAGVPWFRGEARPFPLPAGGTLQAGLEQTHPTRGDGRSAGQIVVRSAGLLGNHRELHLGRKRVQDALREVPSARGEEDSEREKE